MKTYPLYKKIIFLLGFALFISGLMIFTGAFDHNSFIPNNSVALIYIVLGNTIIFASGFLKPRREQ